MKHPPPDRTRERELARLWGTTVGVDEVGRGALAGPVCVGAVAVGVRMGEPPAGLTDSKKLSPRRREALVVPIKAWALGTAVGWATPAEIDESGIIGALRLAGRRAIREVNLDLAATGHPRVGGVLLDGSHDWLSGPPSLLDVPEEDPHLRWQLPVVTQTKADLTCVAVAAASILAKVERDTHMEQLDDPGYDWASNKGYGSAAHRRALARDGASPEHRQTWNLFGASTRG